MTLPFVIKTRLRDSTREATGLAQGLPALIAQILSSRPINVQLDLQQFLKAPLKQLAHPELLIDCDKACQRLASALKNREIIGIETDHDCDGQTSHAVLYTSLIDIFGHPPSHIRSYIGHRLHEGYGLSEKLTDRILKDPTRPSLIITADNGSSDEPSISRLKGQGIDVIVTDHHELPREGPPPSAYACINPTRTDCRYPDPFIAGCLVAWLLLAATRRYLMADNYFASAPPSLAQILDFVAVGTIADCVSMARSPNNRAVVRYGLELLNQGRRPCWRALKKHSQKSLTAEDLAFRLGPLLNSDGRLETAFGSVSFLLAKTDEDAEKWFTHLEGQNQKRKLIQKDIVAQGLAVARALFEQHYVSLCIYLADGHPGVHGIAASRIKDAYGRPTVFLSPKLNEPGILTGSVRGIDDFHVREALQDIDQIHPGLLITFGGHQGAGGLKIRLNDLATFQAAFERAAKRQIADRPLSPVLWTDGTLPWAALSLETLDTLEMLEPFGREFEAPIFTGQASLCAFKTIGDGSHAALQLRFGPRLLRAVWFAVPEAFLRQVPALPQAVEVVYQLKENVYQGARKLDLQVLDLRPL